MASKLIIAAAAGSGGIAPSLVHLAQGFVQANPDIPGFFYFVGVAIFFVLGSLVAFFFAETQAKKAFFLGIGLPAIVATAQLPASGKVAQASIIPTAHAQASAAPAAAASAAAAQLHFKPETDCKDCEIWFANAEGTVIAKQVLTTPNHATAIAVPKGATQFGVADPKSNFKLHAVPRAASAPLTIEFSRSYNALNDLRRGLGNYSLKSYDASVKVKKETQ